MQLNGILTTNTIDLQLSASTKQEALEKMANILHRDGRLSDSKIFLNDVYEREKLETTDMGIGVAIPHGKSAAVLRTSVAIGRLPEPIQWNPEDTEQPVYAIFLLAVSLENQSKIHLELLSSIASLLINDSFITDLQNAGSEKELLESIQKHLGEIV
jgi:fructose-specific phosphotransferase system IIA component